MPPRLETLLDDAPSAVVEEPSPYRRRDPEDLSPVFAHDKAKWRSALYVAAGLIDLTIIAAAHALFRPDHRVAIDRFLAVELVFYAIIAMRMRGIGLLALRYPYEGATRAALAAAGAALATVTLALAFDSTGVLPAAFARETVTTAAVLLFGRRWFAVAAGWLAAGRFTNELVLIDGDQPRSFSRRIAMRAGDLGIAPAVGDPAMFDRIGRLLRHCDRVIIETSADRRPRWLETLRGLDIDVELVAPEFAEQRPFGLRSIDGNPTLLMRRGTPRPTYRVQKRAFDVVVASVALVVTAPVLAALAIAIRRESPGPIFFRQSRVGRGNRQFTVLKFRTMRHDALDFAGVRSAARGDDRVTRIGRFLRRTSLDELPQLLNVLAGDMSIVGPRPHALGSRAGGELFWDVDTTYWERHAIKPGMTGLAQIRGYRGATDTCDDIANRLRADMEYMARWSLLGDMFIVLRTVRVMVHAKAY